MKKSIKTMLCTACLCLAGFSGNAQAAVSKTNVVAWEGMMMVGYVNNGGYVNFGGPTLKVVRKPWSVGFGILPTMRIKEDKVPEGARKNSIVTPTAGFGFTFGFKHLLVQVPFYYNAKTSTSNGKWHPGVGIGFRL